ncbi:polysaccharide pyruvyl transferase family protein [Sulfitobacter donghicola]|uniref:Exosortase n=1 Tax=Sulfitobacter donghicola DSW-25 = KCTC 12864 = JCM 14565 TaxID=1300350 RepID=A0A073IDQ5_9RHOB|nr:polysaccharide pyruvyl transferase family protein [Sulfitobacter donghicola]KEJ88483.1 exosortase [Sulfitobacter donghicola DSW-25 = KCTC 12864 = JCM 14565]KIN69641.1 ExoV domain protein [Sulfitobacter donghicola DSW-25 = KCTC 12864 = JCM 14565]
MSETTLNKSPLRLHWWKAEPNFGDAINPLIVGYMAGRPVEHIGPRRADLFAIGSMLQVVKRTQKEPREKGEKLCVWGTGLLNPIFGHDFLDNVELALVRGPITAALLKREMKTYGDPGLLINEVLPFMGARQDRIGIVPHYSLMDDPDLLALVASDPAFLLIDPRHDEKEVCLQIASCAHVFASSLHGLIIADAYGVSNTWIEPKGQSWLKYHDYAASVGRNDMKTPITLAEVKSTKPTAIAYSDDITAAQQALHESFPARLKSTA